MIDTLKRIFGFEEDRKVVKFHDEPVPLEPRITSSETDISNSVNQVKKTLLKYVPLNEGDCLSCKLISSTIVLGAVVFVLRTAFKYGPKQTSKVKKVVFYVQCTALSTGLASIAVARFFDLGFFEKDKDLSEALKNDWKKLSNYFENIRKK